MSALLFYGGANKCPTEPFLLLEPKTFNGHPSFPRSSLLDVISEPSKPVPDYGEEVEFNEPRLTTSAASRINTNWTTSTQLMVAQGP